MLRTTCIVHRELVRNNKQPSDSRHGERVSDTISRVRTFSSITSSITFNVSKGDTVSRPRNTGVVKDGCNKTEHPVSKSISEFNFSSFQGCRSPSRNKFESIISAYSAYIFRNGGIVPFEKAFQKGDYMSKIDLRDAYFSVPLNLDSQKCPKFRWKDSPFHQVQFLFLCLG